MAPSVSVLSVLTVHSKIESRELMFTFTVYLIKSSLFGVRSE